ncbi:hypothetical protein IB234_19970 [Pseudomonas sp. PDM16]|uniref:hypothetical protein n=1 Tax=Pseudomonas sp. PDM16 TaxID=2769292 RepID=UPI001784BE67|nr:hypothetical protein [Pseudomonas sp. PDM16]MBD9416847.1 hypothetical protein [Pseudomonas sp. PDM16]
MNRSLLFLLLGIVLPAFAEQLPVDVVTFIDDHQNCEHFSGEEPYDEERRAFLNEQLQGCDQLESRRATLQQRYARDPKLLRRLEQYPPL